jgi:hypothetical protein
MGSWLIISSYLFFVMHKTSEHYSLGFVQRRVLYSWCLTSPTLHYAPMNEQIYTSQVGTKGPPNTMTKLVCSKSQYPTTHQPIT